MLCLEEALRELARAVRPEVEEDGRVVRSEPRTPVEHDGLDELVGHAALVARTNRRDGIVRVVALAATDRGERAVRPLPALVPVHGVVAAADRRDPLGGQLVEIAHSGCAATRRARP